MADQPKIEMSLSIQQVTELLADALSRRVFQKRTVVHNVAWKSGDNAFAITVSLAPERAPRGKANQLRVDDGVPYVEQGSPSSDPADLR